LSRTGLEEPVLDYLLPTADEHRLTPMKNG